MKRIFLILSIFLIAACTAEDPPVQDGGRFVVEGWIDSGGAPVVIVTSPVSAQYAEQPVSGLWNHILWRADVRVSDDQGNEVTLTGRRDDHYIPPFIYTTDKMRGAPGHSYRLEVRCNNRFAWSTTRIPAPMPLDHFSLSRGNRDKTFYTLTAHFPPPPEGTLFRFFTLVEGQDSTWCPSTLSGTNLAGGSAPILRGWSVRTLVHDPLFSPGEKVRIKCGTVDEDVYRFWASFDDVANLSNNPVFPATSPLASNVQGAYGIWAGYGVTYGEVLIPDGK